MGKLKLSNPSSTKWEGGPIEIQANTDFAMDVTDQNYEFHIKPIYDKDFHSGLKSPKEHILAAKHVKPFFFDYEFKADVKNAKIKIIVDTIIDEAQLPKILDMFSPKLLRIKKELTMELIKSGNGNQENEN